MNTQRGSIVKAKAGRDKGGFFIVLDTDAEYAYIADGRRRKVEHPKRKKLIHLAPTNTVIEGSFETNPQIKRILKEFIENGG
ncbi:MAG: KOW domain-containing RNA-binding protein [Clostridiales bacterium]|nr:KOW domain-containing RNA-binding protein [Clostridiales bacterium]